MLAVDGWPMYHPRGAGLAPPPFPRLNVGPALGGGRGEGEGDGVGDIGAEGEMIYQPYRLFPAANYEREREGDGWPVYIDHFLTPRPLLPAALVAGHPWHVNQVLPPPFPMVRGSAARNPPPYPLSPPLQPWQGGAVAELPDFEEGFLGFFDGEEMRPVADDVHPPVQGRGRADMYPPLPPAFAVENPAARWRGGLQPAPLPAPIPPAAAFLVGGGAELYQPPATLGIGVPVREGLRAEEVMYQPPPAAPVYQWERQRRMSGILRHGDIVGTKMGNRAGEGSK